MDLPSPSFQGLSLKERRRFLKEYANLSDNDVEALFAPGGLALESADLMIENVVGLISYPLGIATGFLINGRECIVPMATEQRSILSWATRGAELTRGAGGFRAASTGPMMIGQIQLTQVPDFEMAKRRIMEGREEILARANTVSRTRSATNIELKSLETMVGPMLIVELIVDVKDSMGANVVDSMCEAVAPLVENLTEGKIGLRVLSNLATRRMVRVEATVRRDEVGGEVVEGVVEASSFAAEDPYRAATHNKGIMNGVSSVLLATSNDTRAVEAGAHAYASLRGGYRPLSTWRRDGEGNLAGELEMPMQVGIIGGSVSTHPTAQVALKILGVETAVELGEVVASVGLACNLGALQTLVTEGITSI